MGSSPTWGAVYEIDNGWLCYAVNIEVLIGHADSISVVYLKYPSNETGCFDKADNFGLLSSILN